MNDEGLSQGIMDGVGGGGQLPTAQLLGRRETALCDRCRQGRGGMLEEGFMTRTQAPDAMRASRNYVPPMGGTANGVAVFPKVPGGSSDCRLPCVNLALDLA